MDLQTFKYWLKDFTEKVEDLSKTFSYDSRLKHLKNLEEKTLKEGFWDDKDTAQSVIQELNLEKASLQEFDTLKDQLELLIEIPELFELGEDIDFEKEVSVSEKKFEHLETHLFLSGDYDRLKAIVEIHPGAGGTESQDWASMLLRMYQRYCENEGFSYELNDYLDGTEAGLKRATFTVSGPFAYGLLKVESGVHRLVRISPFDSGARRHTSFASVNVVPQLEEAQMEDIPLEDLKIDTYRSSGAGGQSVNTTDSAVRITHLPTNTVVTCQNERSQIKNRSKAMQILQGKLYRLKIEAQKESIDALKNIHQSNAFGSQIRSYVMHPYSMVKDHRTSVETSQVQTVLDGDLNPFIYAMLKHEVDHER